MTFEFTNSEERHDYRQMAIRRLAEAKERERRLLSSGRISPHRLDRHTIVVTDKSTVKDYEESQGEIGRALQFDFL